MTRVRAHMHMHACVGLFKDTDDLQRAEQVAKFSAKKVYNATRTHDGRTHAHMGTCMQVHMGARAHPCTYARVHERRMGRCKRRLMQC